MPIEVTPMLESPQHITGTIESLAFKELEGRNGPFRLLEFTVRPDPDTPLAGVLGGNNLNVGFACSNFNRLTQLGILAMEMCGWDGKSKFDEAAFKDRRIQAQVDLEPAKDGSGSSFWNINRATLRSAPERSFAAEPAQAQIGDEIAKHIPEVVQFVKTADKGQGVPMNKVITALGRRKIDPEQAEAIISAAMDAGQVYEPVLGVLKGV